MGKQKNYRKIREVPFALRPKVEEDLKRLTQERIISPVEFSVWATHIVPVLKVMVNCESQRTIKIHLIL